MTPTTEQIIISDIATVKAQLENIIKNFSQHIKDGAAWRTTIIGLAIIAVTNIVGGAYVMGKVLENVRANTEAIATMAVMCERVQKHIVEDEARWEVFDPKEYMQLLR